MPLSALQATATGCTGLQSITTEESYSQLSSSCVIECAATTRSIGDTVTSTINGVTVHFGYVKKVETLYPENMIQVTVNDPLIRAIDYFIAADDPEAPFQRNNIESLQLVKDLLALAGITNVTNTPPSPSFTWGTNPDGARFNLQSVADAIQFIAQITGNLIWYDRAANQVQFTSRKPYPDGDSPLATWTTGASGNLLTLNYSESTDRTRNIVKVYGKNPILARASASNPYLVVDQAVVIAHELIDLQSMADQTASINLALLNRLERKAEVTLVGNPNISARSVYHLTEDQFTNVDADVFAYRVSHQISSDGGYVTTVTAVL